MTNTETQMIQAKMLREIQDAYGKMEKASNAAEEFRSQQIQLIKNYADGKIDIHPWALTQFIDYIFFFDTQIMLAFYKIKRNPADNKQCVDQFRRDIFVPAYTRLQADHQKYGAKSYSTMLMIHYKSLEGR